MYLFILAVLFGIVSIVLGIVIYSTGVTTAIEPRTCLDEKTGETGIYKKGEETLLGTDEGIYQCRERLNKRNVSLGIAMVVLLSLSLLIGIYLLVTKQIRIA